MSGDMREIKIERIKKGMELLSTRGYFTAADIGVYSPKVLEWYCYQAGGVFIKYGKRFFCASKGFLETHSRVLF
jgi:hypothetical protein